MAGQRVNNLVSLVDLLPTLVDLADQEDQIDLLSPLDGDSLVPLLENRSVVRENVIYGENLVRSCDCTPIHG